MTPEIRPAAVAGTFYPSSPQILAGEVDALLHQAEPPADGRRPKALIVPHAGYRYSGAIAASAYASVRHFASEIRRVILIGPSHRAYFQGVALPKATAFDTPLGPVAIDQQAVACIPDVPRIEAAHAREHALEVQLPFLSRMLARFAIVPLVAGEASGEEVAAVLDALWGGPETLVVVSSDLSHYLPYDSARRIDRDTANRILGLGPSPLDPEQACGALPVNGLLIVARRRGLHPELLDLRSSGDTAGSPDQVVGYGAFAFYEAAKHDA